MTELFIKQCEKAEEIQGEWKPVDWDIFAYKYSKGLGMVWEVIGVKDRQRYIKENCIYLPTQEQLQEMIEAGCVAKLLQLVEFTRTKAFYRSRSFESLNELWLAFVMHEKYNKIWTGEKWEVKSDEC